MHVMFGHWLQMHYNLRLESKNSFTKNGRCIEHLRNQIVAPPPHGPDVNGTAALNFAGSIKQGTNI